MLSKILNKVKDYLFGSIFRRGATYLTVLTLISYILGLVRDITFARTLGASRALDIYNSAFIVPDLLLNIFVAGALTAAFVPVFSHLLADGEDKEAGRLASSILIGAPTLIIILAIPALIFMPNIVNIIAPGFSQNELEQLVHLSRLMLLSPVIFAISNTLGNILISYDRFIAYGLSPIFYNLGIIGGALMSVTFGPIALIIGTIIGAILHLSVRIVGIIKSNFKFRAPLDISDSKVRQIAKLMIPRMAGQPIEQLTFLTFNNFASYFVAGSISMISFARNFQSVPISIFGISFATSVFGVLSRKIAQKDIAGFNKVFKETTIILLALSVISTIGLIIVGPYLIEFLFGGKKFDSSAIATTAKLLAFFALSVPSESMIHLLVRSFYAMKDTWTPILVSVPGLLLIIALSFYLKNYLGLYALPLSYSLVSIIEATILFIILKSRLTKLKNPD